MRQRNLTVGTNVWFPYVTESKTNGSLTYSGFCVDLLDILAETLNFSYTLVLPPDGEWGDNRDGRWTGLVGMLERKEVDMTSAPLSLSVKRAEVADWTVPFEFVSTMVGVRVVDNALGQWGAFLTPFAWQVYVCTLCVWLCCTCLLYGLVRVEHGVLRHPKTASLSGVAEILFGSLLQEALTPTWTRRTTRSFFAAWCLLGLVLASCYTCKLTSLLVDVKSPPPFTSLAEMVMQDGFRWGTINGTKQLTVLRLSKDRTHQAVYQRMMTFAKDDPDILSTDQDVHLAKVLKGGYAYIGYSPTVRKWASAHCEIAVLDAGVTGQEFYVFMTQKNSALTKDVDKVFLKLQGSGVLSHLRTIWFPPRRTDCDDNRSSPRAITLATMQGPYYIAFAGLVLAAGVLLLERGLHRMDISCVTRNLLRGTVNSTNSMKNKTLLVGTLEFPSFVSISNTNGAISYSGFYVDLLDIIADRLNFSYNFVLPPDGEYGDYRDGHWTGLIGQLERKEVDIAAALLTITAERSKVVDWAMPLDYTSDMVAVRTVAVDHALMQWVAFLTPFAWQIYLCVLCVLLCCTCLLYGMTLWEEQHPLSFLTVAEFLFGSLLQEAMPHTWTRGTTRMFVAGWCLLGLVLTACYTCKLTSLFVTVTSPPPFPSLKEMIKQENFQWGMTGGTSTDMALRQSKDGVRQALYRRMMTFAKADPDILSIDLEVHLAKVLKGGYAYIGDSMTLQDWAATHCEIAILDDAVGASEPLSFMTQKNSTLTDDITHLLLRLQDSGVLSYLQNKWIPPRTRCQNKQSSSRAITLTTLQGPFYIALAGLVLAAGVLLTERGLHRRMRATLRRS